MSDCFKVSYNSRNVSDQYKRKLHFSWSNTFAIFIFKLDRCVSPNRG